MAEIQQNDSGKGKKKGHQKKMTIRVDFTPMVDMNMLLITFFMLCTTMIKSQTLMVSLPTNDTKGGSQAGKDQTITVILDAKRNASGAVDTIDGKVVNEVYYYYGKAFNGDTVRDEANIPWKNSYLMRDEFLTDEVNGAGNREARGIRMIIQKKNKDVYEAMKAIKEKYNSGGFGPLETADERKKAQEAYREARKAIAKDTVHYTPQVVIIKSTPEASYGGLVQMLDEMDINGISVYQIDNMTHNDTLLLQNFWKHNGR